MMNRCVNDRREAQENYFLIKYSVQWIFYIRQCDIIHNMEEQEVVGYQSLYMNILGLSLLTYALHTTNFTNQNCFAGLYVQKLSVILIMGCGDKSMHGMESTSCE